MNRYNRAVRALLRWVYHLILAHTAALPPEGGGNVVAAAMVTGSGEREEREPDLVLRAPAWRAGGG